MAVKEFKLPDIGEGIAEGEIVRWCVEEGQQVKEEDEFVEVMTDKATVMITVPFDGVVKSLKAAAGDVVPVESVIAEIETGGGGGKAPPAEAKQDGERKGEDREGEGRKDDADQSEDRDDDEDGDGASPQAPQRRREPEPAGGSARRSASASRDRSSGNGAARGGEDGAKFEQAAPGKVIAAPATRRRAREMGIDLHEVEGTGPRGRVTNEDLRAFVEGGGKTAAPAADDAAPAAPRFEPIAVPKPPQPGATEERVPFRGLRRKIADAMMRSKHTAAHFTYVDDIDVTELVKLRNKAKRRYADAGVNVTYLPFVMKAAVEAMKSYPTMNSSLDETTGELVIKRYFNFGIATDTDNGLIVPVVKDVDRKSIVELARDIQSLAQRTREGKAGIDDLSAGTFTLTNAGNIGGLFATPVINFPEVAILGVHAIKQTPVVRDGRIEVGDVMYLSISIDHRIVDGATGARWMNVVKSCLEDPEQLLFGAP